MAPRVAYVQPVAGRQGFGRTKKVFGAPATAPLTLTAADVALNGQVAVARVPADFVVTSMVATFGACDSGATLSMSIGDATTPARLAATSTTPRAGGTVNLVSTALGYSYPIDTDILLTTTAGAAGLGATPTISLQLEGYIGP